MSRVLVVVDVQNDFCQGGSLAVGNSSEIFKYVNALKKNKVFFQHVILTRDWHPKNHVSFATTHNKQPFTNIKINGKVQELWPDHCVAETNGAKFSPLLNVDQSDYVLSKAIEMDRDSYSGFYEGKNGVQLLKKLQEYNVKEVYVCGLAFDYCVGSTALDSKKYGFETYIVTEGTKPVSQETAEIMEKKLKQNEVHLISFDSVCSL